MEQLRYCNVVTGSIVMDGVTVDLSLPKEQNIVPTTVWDIEEVQGANFKPRLISKFKHTQVEFPSGTVSILAPWTLGKILELSVS